MSSIELVRVTFAYSDSVPLLSDVSLRLSPAWYGVVGPNGAGKTTLLRLVAGELSPERGAIRRDPPGLRPEVCAQRLERASDAIRAFATSTDRLAHRLRGQLRLDPGELERWSTLSAGEQKRWQVGAALAVEPPVLLLDEPTNHLDADARDLLLDALASFRGIGLVVSHDRTLLNRLTESTLRFKHGEVQLFRGGYDRARSTWEADERAELDAYASVRQEERKLERRLGDRRRQRAQAEARASTRRRMKGIHDSDARGRFKAKRRRSAEVSLGREIGKLHRKIDRVRDDASSFRIEKTLGRSLFVDYDRAPVPILLAVDAAEIRAGERLLLEDVQVAVRRESRIRISGPNGVGKSTLIRALVAGAKVPRSRLLYLPQELEPDEELALLESLRVLPPEDRGKILSVIAALGVDPNALLESQHPSPGEARKIALATSLVGQVWGLVLDEPTNHLDLPSIERLEAMLRAYPGALVLVAHDELLARRCTSSCWKLSGRRVNAAL